MSVPDGGVVVVTGAGGPAGHAVVRRLVAAGVRVVGADEHTERLAEVSTSLGADASRFTGRVVDLVDEAELERLKSAKDDK